MSGTGLASRASEGVGTIAGHAEPTDGDGDGYSEELDCDDRESSVHPGAKEILGDDIDQDCDGADRTDGSEVFPSDTGGTGGEIDSPNADAAGSDGEPDKRSSVEARSGCAEGPPVRGAWTLLLGLLL